MRTRFIAVVGRAIARFDPGRSSRADGQWPCAALGARFTRRRARIGIHHGRPARDALVSRTSRRIGSPRRAPAQSRKYCERRTRSDVSAHVERANETKTKDVAEIKMH